MKKNLLSAAFVFLLAAAPSCLTESGVLLPEVSYVQISATSKTVEKGSEFVLCAYAVPSNARDTAIVWTTSNPDVATVKGGLVSALSTGSATITASAAGQKAECAVTVVEAKVPVSGIALDFDRVEVFLGDTLHLLARVLPSDATNQEVAWTSDNEEIAVAWRNVVKGLKLGTTTLHARTLDGGFTASCTLAVVSGNLPREDGSTTEGIEMINDNYTWKQ